MQVWIIRHGEAGFNAKQDSERTLTENGYLMSLAQGKWIGQQMQTQNQQFDKIIVSPFIRAKQTLEAILEGMQAVGFTQNFANQTIEVWEGITPAGNPDNVENYLAFLRDEGAKNILLISHLPLVYDLTTQLVNHQASVHFYPAVLAVIEWTPSHPSLIKIQKP